MKKLNNLFLSIATLFTLTSCFQNKYFSKYSFKDITNHDITDIVDVYINYGPMTSSINKFSGDYEDTFDVNYILSDISYNEARYITENYKYRFFIDFTSNDSSYSDIEMFVYKYKIYFFSDNLIYESINRVDYNEFVKIEKQTINLFVKYDYGIHISNKITPLLGDSLFWFNIKDYEIDELIAGDELVIKYTGEYEVLETYPSRVNAEKINIHSIEVIEADIVEFIVSLENGKLKLFPIDFKKYGEYILSNEGYVVSSDETFKKYDQYPENTILYASMPKTTGSIRVDGLYDYNPKEILSNKL